MPFNSDGLYILEDIAFCNTNQFTQTSRDFIKNGGVYIKAPKGSRDYIEFWDREEDRRINGMSAPGKLVNGKIQDVHITGEHYGFLNYARIRRTKQADINELRNHIVGHDSPLVKHSKMVGDKDMDFPSFIDGQYQWMKCKEAARNQGFHVIMAKSRRKGYSYMEGWDSADTVNMNPYISVLVGAYDYKYITLGDQIMSMAKGYLDFLELHTDFGRGFLNEDIEKIVKLGYKKQETGNIEYGYRSSIIPLSFMNNPDAAVGKDGKKVKFEECGKFPNLKQALAVTLPTLKDGSIMTGQLIMFGTGGSEDANWADFEEIFYNPSQYGCIMCDNIWDDGARGNGVGFFHPQFIGDPLFVDEHGNSEKSASIKYNDVERELWRTTKSGAQYIRELSQDARTPREAFSSGSDNIFPSEQISDQLQRVEHDNDFKYLARYGKLIRTPTGITFKQNVELQQDGLRVHDPVLNFPLKERQDVTGCYVEWISPYRDPRTGKVPKGLYRLWHDPYAHDKDSKDIKIKDSLGVTYVYERVNEFTPGRGDYFIGCYVGRPPRIDEYNEALLNLTEYVNGEVMFENDRGDVKGYFARAKKSHLLADEPNLEWIENLQGKSGRGKGMHMNEARKGTGTILLRDWLTQKRGTDIHGNERLNLHYIYDPAFLRELLKWNPKGNFDRVSAVLVGMYDMKECFNKRIEKPGKTMKQSIFNRKLFTN